MISSGIRGSDSFEFLILNYQLRLKVQLEHRTGRENGNDQSFRAARSHSQ